MKPCTHLCALGLFPLLIAGCRDREITSYRVPKERDAPPAAASTAHADATAATPAAPSGGSGGAMADTAVATAGGANLTWVAPAHWQAKPGSAMRKGTYAVTGDGGAAAELAITAFPGDVGGDVANVNRWRGQIQLPPLPDAEATRSITRFDYNSLKIGFVEMAGTSGGQPTRITGAIVPYQGATWFFKFLGPDALVAKEKAAFLEFLKTIKPPTSTP
ncbi:MAG: hypothetical protein HY736_25815 [Verrucomicrobia bacterium]|nr:hypothetical protein [Verrucomicrobiota bacterium]